MDQLPKFFSVEDIRYERVKMLSDQELATLWLRLERKHRFFLGAFGICFGILLLGALAHGLRTGDAIALTAAIAAAATGFLSHAARSGFAIVDREQDRRLARHVEETAPRDPDVDALGDRLPDAIKKQATTDTEQ